MHTNRAKADCYRITHTHSTVFTKNHKKMIIGRKGGDNQEEDYDGRKSQENGTLRLEELN